MLIAFYQRNVLLYVCFVHLSYEFQFFLLSELQVRAGFFHVIASLSEVYPQLAVEFADQICPAVLYSLDEMDPGVVHALWLAILHTISIVPVSFLCFWKDRLPEMFL